MRRHACLALLAVCFTLAAPLLAQPPAPAAGTPAAGTPAAAPAKALLQGAAKVGDQWQVAIDMQLEGQVVLNTGDKATPLTVKGKTEHKFDERIVKALDGQPTYVGRFYHQASAEFQTHTNKQTRSLRAERRLQAARQTSDGTQVFALHGPLTREELELCGGHADVLAMHGILPNKEAAVGESWDISILAAQALAAMDAVTDSKLKAKLEKIENGLAYLVVTGGVDGIQQGSIAHCEIKAVLEFSLAERRLLRAEWRQRDEHGPGPVHKPSLFESAARITWSYPGPSAELIDAVVAQMPAAPTPGHLLLAFREAKDRYTFTYERNWRQVANNADYAVLRYLERGELLGQVNLRPWKQVRPGDHISPKEFRPLVLQNPDFTLEQIAEEGALAAAPGYWLYRLAAVGKSGDLLLQQNCYAIAGPRGEQVFAIFTCEVAQANKFAGKDLPIVKSLEFPAVVQTGAKP